MHVKYCEVEENSIFLKVDVVVKDVFLPYCIEGIAKGSIRIYPFSLIAFVRINEYN